MIIHTNAIEMILEIRRKIAKWIYFTSGEDGNLVVWTISGAAAMRILGVLESAPTSDVTLEIGDEELKLEVKDPWINHIVVVTFESGHYVKECVKCTGYSESTSVIARRRDFGKASGCGS